MGSEPFFLETIVAAARNTVDDSGETEPLSVILRDQNSELK